jgi:hypothetical protein
LPRVSNDSNVVHPSMAPTAPTATTAARSSFDRSAFHIGSSASSTNATLVPQSAATYPSCCSVSE